jgi:hypothetical protein
MGPTDGAQGVWSVINVRPGYWDVDSCAWVGVDPVYVVPPLRHAEHPHDRTIGTAAAGELPEPRSGEIVLEPEAPTGS